MHFEEPEIKIIELKVEDIMNVSSEIPLESEPNGGGWG